MEITEVEIHEFRYRVEDVGPRPDGEMVYVPGSAIEPPGYVLQIRTADGTEGHYRAHMWAPVGAAQIEAVADHFLIGRDPLAREEIWSDLRRQLRHTDHNALGAIDVALWDLAGRHHGTSVATLLGGRRRDRVPAYASTMSGNPERDTPERYAGFAADCLARGYGGFKIHPHGDPDADAEICRAVADRVGGEMDLMLDPASLYQSYADTLRVGRVMDECGFFWYEDPMADTGESMAMEKKLADELDTPILGMEHVRGGAFGRADHLAAGALDFVRGDAHLDGGITGLMKVASTVEAFGLDVEPHVGGPAHLHCLAAIRNANYFEHGLLHPEIEWMSASGFTEPVAVPDDAGRVAVPDGPGLGVEIDWEYVEANETRHTLIDGSGSGAFA